VRLLPASTQAAAWIRYPAMGLKLYLSFAIASLSYNYFEKRFLSLKGRFEPEYGTTPSPSPGGAPR
jgi:peptidoglycan/LPS O-acetylase OafA/YrhL